MNFFKKSAESECIPKVFVDIIEKLVSNSSTNLKSLIALLKDNNLSRVYKSNESSPSYSLPDVLIRLSTPFITNIVNHKYKSFDEQLTIADFTQNDLLRTSYSTRLRLLLMQGNPTESITNNSDVVKRIFSYLAEAKIALIGLSHGDKKIKNISLHNLLSILYCSLTLTSSGDSKESALISTVFN